MPNRSLQSKQSFRISPPSDPCGPKRGLYYLVMVFVLFGSLVIAQAKEPNPVLSANELKKLATEIAAIEKSLLNVKIESEAWIETKASLSDPCEPWQRTPICAASTAWFDGHPKGKVRVDVQKEVTVWIQGHAPYFKHAFSIGFDGQYGRVAYHTTGYPGKTYPLKEAKILPDAPKNLRSTWVARFAGIHFSLHFFFADIAVIDYTFSDIFRWASEPNCPAAFPFEFSREEFEGAECIKVALKGAKGPVTIWWLDPSRGFALLGHKYITRLANDTARTASFMKVSKLKEVAPGLWWPMEASIVSAPMESGETYEHFVHGSSNVYERFVYRASNVVANDPNFDESIFTVPFPDGYLIDDQVTSRKYRVGEE